VRAVELRARTTRRCKRKSPGSGRTTTPLNAEFGTFREEWSSFYDGWGTFQDEVGLGGAVGEEGVVGETEVLGKEGTVGLEEPVGEDGVSGTEAPFEEPLEEEGVG